MSDLYTQSMGEASSLGSIDHAAPTNWAGCESRDADETNTIAISSMLCAFSSTPTGVSQTINHAMNRYEDLLRKLAD